MIKKPKKPLNAQNPAGPVDKPRNTKIAGQNDETRVVYSEEHNKNDGD